MFKRRSNVDTQKLTESLEKVQGKSGFQADPNEWTITKDEAGNASARVRILPPKGEGNEDTPFVKIFSHHFQGNGWYIENCPTTIDGKCPVCEANSELWNSGIEDNKKLASSRKRKMSYWANIVVLNDARNPDAVGKVFKWRFGKQIMDIIVAKAKGDPETGVKGIDITDPWEGADLIIRFEKTKHGGTYTGSTFEPVSELYDGDEAKLKEVFNGLHPLKPITDASEFKEYDQLATRFARVTGGRVTPTKTIEDDLREDLDSLNQVEDTSDDIPFDMGDNKKAADTVATAEVDDLDDFFAGLEE